MLYDLEDIKLLVSDNGLDISQYKESILKRKLESRMRVNGIDSYTNYLKFLGDNEEEMRILVSSLLINVTQFFRDNSVFDFFTNNILPIIVQNKGDGEPIRIWSAGCSTGEEPYSLAMVINEVFDNLPLTIIATDVNKEAIRNARLGEYKEGQLTDMEKRYLRFFDNKGDRYTINKAIKDSVRFLNYDILSDKKLGSFDAIFCRNLLIYLSRESQRIVLERMHCLLSDGGFLILGKTEIMPRGLSDKFTLFDLNERVYIKN